MPAEFLCDMVTSPIHCPLPAVRRHQISPHLKALPQQSGRHNASTALSLQQQFLFLQSRTNLSESPLPFLAA